MILKEVILSPILYLYYINIKEKTGNFYTGMLDCSGL